MDRGWLSLLEDGAPTLIAAAVVLVAGVGYGLYERHQAEPVVDTARPAVTQPAQTSQP